MECNLFTINLENGSTIVSIPQNHKDIEKIKHFVKNSFEEFYFGRNNIIIYQDIVASPRVLELRKNFLEWLVKRSMRENIHGGIINFITENYKKTIKLNFAAQSVSTQNIYVYIQKSGDSSIAINIKNEFSGLIYNYLKAKFILHAIYQDRNTQTIKIRLTSQRVKDELKIIIQKKTLVGKKVIFSYPREIFDFLGKTDQTSDQSDSIRSKINKLKTSYQLLELSYLDQDMGLIKQRYRTLAKRYHPDRTYYTNPTQAKEYEEKFISIKDAYETICAYLSQKSA